MSAIVGRVFDHLIHLTCFFVVSQVHHGCVLTLLSKWTVTDALASVFLYKNRAFQRIFR